MCTCQDTRYRLDVARHLIILRKTPSLFTQCDFPLQFYFIICLPRFWWNLKSLKCFYHFFNFGFNFLFRVTIKYRVPSQVNVYLGTVGLGLTLRNQRLVVGNSSIYSMKIYNLSLKINLNLNLTVRINIITGLCYQK